MNIIDLIQQRRSCRIFAEQPIEKEKVEALKKAALWSPTSKNNRPWEFVFVDDTDLLQQLATCKPHGAAFLAKAPMAVVILADPKKSDVWIEDTSVAAAFIQLAAEDLGLGSCWIQVRGRDHESGQKASETVKEILKAPAHLETTCIISLGYKAKERRPYNEHDMLTERIRHNQF